MQRRLWAEAMALGSGEGYVRAFVDGCPARVELLEQALGGEGRGHAEWILAHAGIEAVPAVPRITAKQHETLRWLAEGLSNRDIARAMAVSETTVKTHLRDVYRRFGVRSRTQAIAAARSAGLL